MSRVAAALVLFAVLVPAGSAGARAPAPSSRSVTLEWVGDIALSAQRGLPPGGVTGALRPVRRTLRDADLTLGNLEGTLSTGGRSKCAALIGNCFAFQAPPALARPLRAAGFDLLNQANNHALDFGPSRRDQTRRTLRTAGIATTGAPGQITILRAHGVRIAVVGFAPYPYAADLLDIPAAQALVRRARRRAPLVAVIIHAGAEGAAALHTPYGSESFAGENRGDPRAFAHAVIRAGAAVVLGSGPHVIRGVERYRGRLIAYSLGNFLGYHTLQDGGVLSDSAILRVTLDLRGRVLAGRWIPLRLIDGLPRPDPRDASAHLVAALSRQDFPRDHFDIGPTGGLRPAVHP
ncbi:MAG TPA: CapA family protein [Solirubrobacteraceae bacterium]|nr:CapA family protein [Solirubrobacteraceae bacterium]